MGNWKLIVWGKGSKLGSHDVRYINHSQTFHSNYSFQKFVFLDPPKTVIKYIKSEEKNETPRKTDY